MCLHAVQEVAHTYGVKKLMRAGKSKLKLPCANAGSLRDQKKLPDKKKKKKSLMNQCYFKAGGIVRALVFIVGAKRERQLCFHMVIDY